MYSPVRYLKPLAQDIKVLANFFARVEHVGEKRQRENMSVLNSSECRVGDHYLLKCPGFGLLVASLQA